MRVFQGEHREEVGAVERNVNLTIHHRSACFDVGHVEEVLVGSAREADRRGLADPGMGTVTAGDKRRLARLETAVCVLELRDDMIAAFFEANEFCLPLDRD